MTGAAPVVEPAAAGGGLDRAEAFLRQHRNASLLGAGVLVAAFALLQRRRAKAGATPGAAVSTGYAPASYTAGSDGSATGTYDSTGSDVYNAIQPAVESLQASAGSLADSVNTLTAYGPGGVIATAPDPGTPAPTPTPATPSPVPAPKPAAPKATYVAKAGDTVWTVAPRFGLSPTQLLTLNPNSPAHTTHKFTAGETLRVQL